ncbi:hypothetical protein BD410DRAFT_786308 [Rickenella mellea]|uniref:SH3 domain-containing protein n=1 Tax=Rickenella mellea TaxID=50990 RepID=A0A4Y7Q978_9AGAM|nr:hypothetical protein BD410DRAFT_786308 [Rickenella mellea]
MLRLATLSHLFALPALASATLPKVDFNRMGNVGLAGAFAGLDFFNNSTSVSFDPSTATLLSRASDGSLTRLGSTNAGGKVSSGCALGGAFYFGGLFTSVNGTSATNVASFSPSSGTFSALGTNGPNGEVKAVFCDSPNNRVWVGGSFSSPASAVAVWDTKANSWAAPPFGGLTGASAEVLSITTNSSDASVFFAGSFVTSFQGNGSVLINGTNNPNVPFSAGATPFSSSLVPIPLQGAQIDPSAPSTDPNFSNIQNILCPAGADGPGNTWLSADGFQAVINVRAFRQIAASGIRLGNTFQNGRSTTGFSVTSIPDNTVQPLTFINPSTGANQTCTDPCPLLADPSIPYQDFLFPASSSITGFQLKLSEWTGAGPGLHLLQLLSSGAFASAVNNLNNVSCFAPNPSTVTLVGTWTERQVVTDIAGTVQDVLTASVDVGTPSAQAPSITWMPYVSASGIYTISMLIPGCTNFQDCALRTDVKVSVFPGGGLGPTVTTLSQQNQQDVTQVIYQGPVFPTSPQFVATITMTLADGPSGTGQGGKFELIADRIDLVLDSVTGNSTTSVNGTNGTSSANSRQGFGFFEWPLSEKSTVNANAVLPNSTETALDNIAFQLFTAAGGNISIASSKAAIAAVAHHSSGAVFLGGNFTFSSGSNIFAFKNGALAALAGTGLNGPVTSLVIDGDTLFVGGSFTDTASPSTNGALHGIAAYSISSNTWSALQGGVQGTVSSLGLANGQLQVAGDFSRLLESAGSTNGPSAGGFAVWNVNNATWANPGGFLVGSMTFVGNGTAPGKGQTQGQILAGSLEASLKFGATGFVMLQNSKSSDGVPNVVPLGVQLDGIAQTPAAAPAKRRRANANTARSTWMSSIPFAHLFKRQSTTTPPPLPQSPSAPAPAVLAGAFWTNTSNSHSVAVLGGNFSFTATGSTSESEGVAFYDLKSGSVNALSGNPVNGTVRALLVAGDALFIGGEFTLTGNDGVSGLAIYDLAEQKVDVSGLQALQGNAGTPVVVRSLTTSAAKPNTVVVAGSFAKAGSLACAGICLLDASTKQWSALGSGIAGEVASVRYAGDNQDLLFASGSIVLSGTTVANVAMFSFSNSTWTAVGNGADIPGPVTAIEVDNGNASSVFAAGRLNDGSSSFLSFWNGASWSSLGAGFEGDTNVSQLTMVPLQESHASNGIIEQDRMLMVSGSLISSTFGNASSALFDGQNFFPYIVSTSSSGKPGAISSLFSSISNFGFSTRHFLATGVVILISIAIAAGVVFFLALLGILWTLFARRDGNKIDPAELDEDDDSTHHRPSSLLEHINAATRTTILGAGSTSPYDQKEKEEEAGAAVSTSHGHDPFATNADDYLRAETPSEAIAGMGAGMEEQSRPAHARYSFDGSGEGELRLVAGMELEVLDDRDPAWWYARDINTGREGVVPASYLY